MNRIIREHYPASKLPEDLKEGIDPQANVTITIAEEADERRSAFSFDEIFRTLHESRVRSDDPVMRRRALREEWDERERSLADIPRGGSD